MRHRDEGDLCVVDLMGKEELCQLVVYPRLQVHLESACGSTSTWTLLPGNPNC